ncbi:M91 family zinc metallopeptidase [Streptomyces sp. NPDC015237]|uniref:M91 family zinc metallopeptidase n=1 Tax=Streptomyces sp. NPDC015237 TaxID=3364949 RepID=UPI0036F59963
MRAQKGPGQVDKARLGQESEARRVPPVGRRAEGLLALGHAAGNDAVARAVGEQRHTGVAPSLAVVQRAPAASAAVDAADPEVQHLHDFAKEALASADKLIAQAESFRWSFKSLADKQKLCDELGTVLDTAEHMIYGQFRGDPAGKADNARNRGLKALLDEIQQRHFSYVRILRKTSGLRPVGMDLAAGDTEGAQKLSDTWSRVASGRGIATSTKPLPAGDDPNPAALEGFDTEMLSSHARLLSRQHGRGLVSDLASDSASTKPTVKVVPYHPEVVKMIGKTDLAAQADADDRPSALAESAEKPNTGSTSTVSVPHKFRDSEVAKDGESHTPVFAVYGHELIHAQHNKHGINVADLGTREDQEEEKATVSGTESSARLHRTKNLGMVTEEMLRDEHNLPRRGGYT